MRPLTSTELNRIVSHSADSFSDSCTVDTKTVTRNSFGEEVATFTSGSQIPCGFELVGGEETSIEELIFTKTKGVFRLPMDTVITIEDRITLKSRYNQTVNYTFEVVTEPVKNLDCIRVEGIFIGV